MAAMIVLIELVLISEIASIGSISEMRQNLIVVLFLKWFP